MKKLLALAACFLLSCAAYPQPKAPSVKQEATAVFKLEGKIGPLRMGNGTAFHTGVGVLYSAGHVCAHDGLEWWLVDRNNQRHRAFVLHYVSPEYDGNGVTSMDACMLVTHSVDIVFSKGLKVNFDRPQVGEKLHYIGAPLGFWTPATPNVECTYSGPADDFRDLLGCQVAGGASGSPVLNANSEVVGIVISTFPGDGLSLMTPMELTKDL